MRTSSRLVCALCLGFALVVGLFPGSAPSAAEQVEGTAETDDARRMETLMMDVGLVLLPMDSRRGRELFVDKGCVVCHSVNGVGGTVGPALNAAGMPKPMNTLEFAARMWRGAVEMIQLQQDVLGQQIDLSGQDLADLIAFAHDESEQKRLTEDQVPEHLRDLILE